jgi:segregation and condensation protein B
MSDDSQDANDSEPFDELDEEFSLDKLSKAYADVIRKRSGDGESSEPDHEAAGESAPPAKETPSPPEEKKSTPTATESQTDDNRGCPIEPETIIESIVFVGAPRGEALTLDGIAAVLRDVSAADVRKSAQDLNEKYEQDNSAWRIVIEGDGDDAEIKMVLVDDLAEFQNHYFGRNKEVQLSQGTIDVLAVVAYHQPVTKTEIENTRGKPSGSVLSQLVRRDLLEVEVTQDKPAKRLYRTSKRFLDLFQLDDVQDLPQSHDVSEFEEYID